MSDVNPKNNSRNFLPEKDGYNISIIGATGLVGREIVASLMRRRFPVNSIEFFAGQRSSGSVLYFNDRPVVVRLLTPQAVKKSLSDIAIFSAGADVSGKFAPIFARHGTIVIDNSSRWRRDKDVPLIVPEVNSSRLFIKKNIIANPNCSTIQAVVALAPLHATFGIRRIIYTTFQSVSGAGKAGIEALTSLTDKDSSIFGRQIRSNAIPKIGEFDDNGYSEEENKLIFETKKILDDDKIKITATAVRIPVEYCHCESINVEFKCDVTLQKIIKILSRSPGIFVYEKPDSFPTPLDAKGQDKVLVGRIRMDQSRKNAVNFWVVADNIRKGAATNAVQIAELLVENKVNQ